ncbi:DNA-binding GntR family transcriptional regulator [Pseudochelatococcus lubricantis]|uniref:DNA-binding GntR family transcriptional regulator n=1 Tax=Pseudochelatococcus lubricantis TaxID=1538102 RepID=A0ABX0V0H2_9HYPH|nr:UTRA domain-containing protein [Pseudochelatococcus lubricantis]NIJ58123.1 DNA-binding GntR family transcriptional regulator [Pseudochelatococcus lubricantis]
MRGRLLRYIDTMKASGEVRLPSERQLADSLHTTRITLREALTRLEAEGIIYRETRRGWFISPERIVYNPLSRSYFDEMARSQGRGPRTELIEGALQPAPASVATLIGLDAGAPLILIRRVRFLDSRPVLYVEHYLRNDIFNGILDEDLTQSLTEIYMSRYDVHLGGSQSYISSRTLTGDMAERLHASEGSPALHIARINYDQSGRTIDCDLEFWRHDALLVHVKPPK